MVQKLLFSANCVPETQCTWVIFLVFASSTTIMQDCAQAQPSPTFSNDTLSLLTSESREGYPLVQCDQSINLNVSTDYVTYVQFYSPHASRYTIETCQSAPEVDGSPTDTVLFFNGTTYDTDSCGPTTYDRFEESINVSLPGAGFAMVGVGLFWDNRTLPAVLWISCPLDSAPPTTSPTSIPSMLPTHAPSTTAPTFTPTNSPLTVAPTSAPTTSPTATTTTATTPQILITLSSVAASQTTTEPSSPMDPFVIIAIIVAFVIISVCVVYFWQCSPTCETSDNKVTMQAIDGISDESISHTMFTNPLGKDSKSNNFSRGGEDSAFDTLVLDLY